jgi:hypothetical protein
MSSRVQVSDTGQGATRAVPSANEGLALDAMTNGPNGNGVNVRTILVTMQSTAGGNFTAGNALCYFRDPVSGVWGRRAEWDFSLAVTPNIAQVSKAFEVNHWPAGRYLWGTSGITGSTQASCHMTGEGE